MSIPNHLETTEVVLLEVEILFTIIATGAWGDLLAILSAAISKRVTTIPIRELCTV